MVDDDDDDDKGDSEVDRAMGITPAVLLSSIGGLFPLTVSIVSVRSLPVRAVPAGPLMPREADGDGNGTIQAGLFAAGLRGDGRNGAPVLVMSKVDMAASL